MTEFTALTWNVFHGRDAPPDPALFTRRSRFRRTTEDNGEYVQVNRPLRDEYSSAIAGASWSVCLLQEMPPQWTRPLAAHAGAAACRALTSRNQLGWLRAALARANPDLVGASEGGSNLTLVRSPWRLVPGSCRSLLLNPLPERRFEERRRMSFVRMRLEDGGAEVCIANLHASTGPRVQTERELRRAAATAVQWAGAAPLVLGGDFNVRPRTSPALFEELEREHGLVRATAANAIDHLLARNLEIVSPPAAWPPERRELQVARPGGMRLLRLSDHAQVEARFRLGSESGSSQGAAAITTGDGYANQR